MVGVAVVGGSEFVGGGVGGGVGGQPSSSLASLHSAMPDERVDRMTLKMMEETVSPTGNMPITR